ncbi:MAG: electron transfer flavoprotein subunit beta/FixA family protein [Deltaproteobacteria bacterium]
MKAVVCTKKVLDPDAVNNYALEGRLEIGDDGKTMTQTSIPALMNAYDEQAIEAVLKLRDAGLDVSLAVVAVGTELADMLKHAAALGADEVTAIDSGGLELDNLGVARLLAAYIEKAGADLVLCGRQASDDDQGVVPGFLGELLGVPVVTVARAVDSDGGATVKVVRVTPDGDETVEVTTPALVTISNELGEPRYPTMQSKMRARKKEISQLSASELGLDENTLEPMVSMVRQYVPELSGDCEFIGGASPSELAGGLVAKLKAEQVI